MHLRPPIHGLLLTALLLPAAHAQTDHPPSPTPVTRAVALYEWTGPSDDPTDHPSAARLLPISLFLHAHLEDAGVYLAQPIPFALQPGTLYLIQRSGQTLAALDIQSAHAASTTSTTTPSWIAFGRLLTPVEALAATTPKPSPTPLTLPADDATTPTPTHTRHRKHEKKKPQQPSVTPPTTPILDDPDRPLLAPAPPTPPATLPELTTLPTDLHQAIAISDAANRPPETFAYPWPSRALRDQTLQTLEALALPPLTHYLAFNHLTPTSPGPTTLLHPQLLAYTLAASAPPTYILTAETPLITAGPVYLTLIAQPTGPAGALRLTLLSLTDAPHLDRTPRLLPIGAVDPDASGRADLLFELRSQTTRQFALYSLTTGHADPILLTTPTP